MVGRPAEAGAAVRCRRGPLRGTAEAAAGLRTAATDTVQPGPRHGLAAGLFGGARPGPQHAGDRRCGGGGYRLSTLRKARIDLNVRLQRVSVSVPVTRGFDAAASTNLVCGRRSVRSPVRRSTGAGSRLGEERSRQDTAPRYICLGRHPRRQAIRGPAGNYGVGCTADVRLAAWRPTTRP